MRAWWTEGKALGLWAGEVEVIGGASCSSTSYVQDGGRLGRKALSVGALKQCYSLAATATASLQACIFMIIGYREISGLCLPVSPWRVSNYQ
jgi:hypothetical protein